MNISLISFTENGRLISEKIYGYRNENLNIKRYTFKKFSDKNSISFEKLGALTEELFQKSDALVFISSCGIAVRAVSPFLKSKANDPAVVAIDEGESFAVSLLSGHLGGANALAVKLSEILGCVPVVTTATDVGGKFSPDSFALANELCIRDLETAKLIAAKIVDGGKIGFYSDYKYINRPDDFFDDNNKKLGICVSESEKSPFERTLNLVPKNIVIGVGCRKNIDVKLFDGFLNKMLVRFEIPFGRIREIHTVDIKKDEAALIEFSRKYKIPLRFYSSEELMRVEGNFSCSDFVRSVTGADNVCERSACASGGALFVGKQAENGMTFAAAKMKVILDFEREIL